MTAASPVVAILGAGQLGRMLGLAAIPMGVRCRFLDPAAASAEGCPAGAVGEVIAAEFTDRGALDRLADGADAVTYEFENVPVEAVEYLAQRVPVSPPPLALRTAQDRLLEKQLFKACGVPTNLNAPWDPSIDSRDDLLRILRTVGFPAVIKTRRMGYDGKGQGKTHSPADLDRTLSMLPKVPLLIEQHVGFRRELSIVAVRSARGETRFYPLVRNVHEGGILRTTTAPAPDVTPGMEQRARAEIRALMDRLGYVGVMALELFDDSGGLMCANEIAPRVHNTGHWTIEGAPTSQFENHIRAILGWPLGETAPVGHSVMLNLIGQDLDRARALAIPGVSYHWYGKAIRPGRKVGHVTVRADTAAEADSRASMVEACFLPQ